MRAAKVDSTHREIVNALRAARVCVHGTAAVGRGFPDAVASLDGFTALVECKTGNGKLNAAQQRFHDEWQGAVIVARSGEEAVQKFMEAKVAALKQASL
jgi:hypothetical protein